MNLLSDLNNELAMAMLVEKQYAQKFSDKDGVDLIEKVTEILQPMPVDEESLLCIRENANAANH